VPDYLTSVPEDVFTGKPMQWDPVHEVVYSDGPNGVDDRGSINTKRPYKGADVGMSYWWSNPPSAAPKKP
jgi:hypothetical protein